MGKLFPLLLTSVFLLFCLVMPTAAGTITAELPVQEINAGETVTIPVTISEASDILGFKMYVWNTVPGTDITINSSKPLNTVSGSSYDINSASSRDYQVISWTTSDLHGISGDAVLFYIDIHSSTASPTTIPVTLEVLPEMYDSTLSEVSSSYTVQRETISVKGTNPLKEEQRPTQTETPVVSPTEESKIPEESTKESGESIQDVLVPVPTLDMQIPTTQPASPLSLLSCLGVGIAFGFFARRERK